MIGIKERWLPMKQLQILFLLVILLSACNNFENDQNLNDSDNPEISKTHKVISETDVGEFVLRLVSEKMFYQPGEEIHVKGKLKYIGEKDELEIAHSQSPFFFDMIEVNRGVEIPYLINDSGKTTILQTNDWFEETYVKKVAFSESDEDADFLKVFADEDGFPVGEYEIELRTDFHTSQEGESKQHNYTTSIVIVVKE